MPDVAEAAAAMQLPHVVVTSVDRDDLEDGGAEHFAQTIRAVRHRSPETTIEILTPDFLKCPPEALEKVVEARPDVFNHNLETVPRLYRQARPGADYAWSLALLHPEADFLGALALTSERERSKSSRDETLSDSMTIVCGGTVPSGSSTQSPAAKTPGADVASAQSTRMPRPNEAQFLRQAYSCRTLLRQPKHRWRMFPKRRTNEHLPMRYHRLSTTGPHPN